MDLSKLKICGPEVKIYEPNTIINPEQIEMAGNVIISEYCWLMGGCGLKIGRYVHIAPYTYIGGGGYCEIGSFANIAARCTILTGTDDTDGSGLVGNTVPIEYRKVTRSKVFIENYAFLCVGVIVMPGVTIGEGSIIGAGSIVNRDTEPWTKYWGTPIIPTGKLNRSMVENLSDKLLKGGVITK
jgi:galactoside O-acetyltransferase